VKEVYILSRLGSVPYEIRKVIPLGTEVSAPLYQTVKVAEDQ
jgi:hypothetical protein